MKKISAALLLIALATPALAQQITEKLVLDPIKATSNRYFPLVVTAADHFTETFFRMEEGACLRGPLAFTGTDGKELFRLAADAEYPTNCGVKK